MELITLADIKDLIRHELGVRISIYLPTYEKSQEVRQNSIRFKNLLSRIESQLEKVPMAQTEKDELLEPARELIGNNEFWQHQTAGLAVFIDPEGFYFIHLPDDPGESAHLEERFYIRPLIPFLTRNQDFYVLGVGMDQIRLLRCHRFYHKIMDLEKLIEAVKEEFKYDDPEKSLQFHTGTPGTGKRAAVFHGQGTTGDAKLRKKEIERYMHALNRGLSEEKWYQKMDKENAPLVVAAIPELQSVFRKVCDYNRVSDDGIDKNPRDCDDEDLRNMGWDIVSQMVEDSTRQQVEGFFAAKDEDKTTTDAQEIVEASAASRISTLMFYPDFQLWGTYHATNHRADLHDKKTDGGTDLVNFTILNTLNNGGTILQLDQSDMPVNEPLAAILRF